jgi:positive regulator of sigma E activity
MNEMNAVVVRLEDPYAWVQAAGPGPACGACAQKTGCGSIGGGGLLEETTGQSRKAQLLRLPNTIHARPGDAVVIRAAEGMVLKAVWRAYGTPLLLGLLLAILASALTGSEPVALAAMLAGLVSGFLLMRWKGLESGRSEPILSMRFKGTSVISVKGQET